MGIMPAMEASLEGFRREAQYKLEGAVTMRT
jgi:hypothetical protein